MQTINLREWNISYTELVEWCEKTNSEVYAVIHHGGNGASAMYGFEKDEDLLAFTLTFSHKKNETISFYTNGVCRLTIPI